MHFILPFPGFDLISAAWSSLMWCRNRSAPATHQDQGGGPEVPAGRYSWPLWRPRKIVRAPHVSVSCGVSADNRSVVAHGEFPQAPTPSGSQQRRTGRDSYLFKIPFLVSRLQNPRQRVAARQHSPTGIVQFAAAGSFTYFPGSVRTPSRLLEGTGIGEIARAVLGEIALTGRRTAPGCRTSSET